MKKKVVVNIDNLRFFKDFFRENKNDKDFMVEMLELFKDNLSLLHKETDEAIHKKDCEECAHAFHHMTNNFSAMRLCKHGIKSQKLERKCKEGCFSEVVSHYRLLEKDMTHILSETDYLLHNYVSKESVLTH